MQIDPDGNQEKEWCRIDEELSGKQEKNWRYCTDDLDMDSVRMAVSDFYESDMKLMKYSFIQWNLHQPQQSVAYDGEHHTPYYNLVKYSNWECFVTGQYPSK